MPGLGFVLLYTPSVPKKIAFYERAFGVERKYIAENEAYGEIAGTVPLSFVQEEFAKQHGTHFIPARASERPPAIEIGFVFDDVEAAYRRAVAAGATPVSPPEKKPWGQTVSYVRDDDGVLVEICTPWSV
jgi:catechol 2,3-dioxygenase-like lactoylglutathione lyase family enzyme